LLLQPVLMIAEDPANLTVLLDEIGWDAESLLGAHGPQLLTDFQAIGALVQAIDGWIAKPPDTIGELAKALKTVEAAAQAMYSLPTALQGVKPQGFDRLPEELFDVLFASYLLRRAPLLYQCLTLLTVVTNEVIPQVVENGVVIRVPKTRNRFNPDQLLALIHDPVHTLAAVYMPNGLSAQADVNAATTLLFPRLVDVLKSAGAQAMVGRGGSPAQLGPDEEARLASVLTAVWQLSLSPGALLSLGASTKLVSAAEHGPGIFIAPFGDLDLQTAFGRWLLEVLTTAKVGGFLVRRDGVDLVPLSGSTSTGLSVTATLTRVGAGDQALLVGSTGGSRLEIGRLLIKATADIEAAGASFGIESQVSSAALVIQPGDGDGFLKSIFPTPIKASFDLSIGWSSSRGLYFGGGTGLDVTLPFNRSILGVLTLRGVHLLVSPKQSAIRFQLAASVAVELGPVTASVEKTGMGADLSFPSGGGNLGNADLSVAFKLPDGVALAISAPSVSGSGFLQFDSSNGQYLGEISLTVGQVSIQAIGVLTTRTAAGGSGYSLVVLASAGFPPVELGFGFDLVGLGGLIGVNRTVDTPSLQALARAGSLDNLMFPTDLKHKAPQVAASLATTFPPTEGHFIVGPAVRLSWGTSGILDAQIGVYFELTDSGGGITLLRVALLGWMHLTLPNAKAPVTDITLDVLGSVDLPAKMLSIDASLMKSKIAGFTLTGQAALRATWGTNPAFVLAIGGFNPHFAAPAGFPALARVALSIGDKDPRLRMTAYLALTSNTLQLGAAADLYASAGPAAVKALLSFDAFIQYKPFGLVVDLSIAASVLFDGNPLLTLLLDLHIIGPDPWHVTGSASFQILFWTVSVPINLTVGTPPPVQLPQRVDLDGNLEAAIHDVHSWQIGAPPGSGSVVVRGLPAADPGVHPLATLTLRERAVPLGLRITRYGPDLLDAPCMYDIVNPQIAGTPDQNVSPISDYFAPAQFNSMTDHEKLSSPSFQLMTAGLNFGPPGLVLPGGPNSLVDKVSSPGFYTLVVDSPDPVSGAAAPLVKSVAASTAVSQDFLNKQRAGAAAAVKGPVGQGSARFAVQVGPTPRPLFRLTAPTFALVDRNLESLLPSVAPPVGLPSYSAAIGGLANMGVRRGAGQVVYSSEVP